MDTGSNQVGFTRVELSNVPNICSAKRPKPNVVSIRSFSSFNLSDWPPNVDKSVQHKFSTFPPKCSHASWRQVKLHLPLTRAPPTPNRSLSLELSRESRKVGWRARAAKQLRPHGWLLTRALFSACFGWLLRFYPLFASSIFLAQTAAEAAPALLQLVWHRKKSSYSKISSVCVWPSYRSDVCAFFRGCVEGFGVEQWVFLRLYARESVRARERANLNDDIRGIARRSRIDPGFLRVAVCLYSA